MLSAYNLGNQRCKKYLPAVHSPSGEERLPGGEVTGTAVRRAPRGAQRLAGGPRVGGIVGLLSRLVFLGERRVGKALLLICTRVCARGQLPTHLNPFPLAAVVKFLA